MKTSTAQTSGCSCFNSAACAARRAKGLVPFCEMQSSIIQSTDGLFGSLVDAQAAFPGRRVGVVSGGLGTGSAARFGLRWSEVAVKA